MSYWKCKNCGEDCCVREEIAESDALKSQLAETMELMRKVWNRIPPWESLKDPEQYNAMMGDISEWVTQAKLWPKELS